uniref:Uncharacterized protein n=1 Tax=Fagus sylvatica TaxID=28930 RepID=A0A2N9I095_FAGSY
MAFQGKKLINDPNDVVTEFIEGLVETYPGLQYLDGFPEVKVVLRADVSSATYDKVAIISVNWVMLHRVFDILVGWWNRFGKRSSTVEFSSFVFDVASVEGLDFPYL